MAKGAEFLIDNQDRINYFSLVKRPRRLRVVIATCALSLFSTANPANADGSLDSSFDTDGKVTTAIGSAADGALSVAIQSDGKIVVAGYSNNGSNNDFALARYNTDGSLDTSFDTDGKVTTAIGSAADYGRSVAIQSDGKIVAAGYSNNGSDNDFALARYNTDGSLGGSSPGAVVDNSAAQAAAQAQRETEKRNARAEILDKWQKSESIPITLFAQAEIAGITEENDKDVQAEMAAIPEISRVDITQVLKIARKYEVVGRIASEQVSTVYSSELIEVGLISSESKHRATLTAALRKLPAPLRSSYAQIEVALNAHMETIQARKDRLAAVIARNAARNAA